MHGAHAPLGIRVRLDWAGHEALPIGQFRKLQGSLRSGHRFELSDVLKVGNLGGGKHGRQ